MNDMFYACDRSISRGEGARSIGRALPRPCVSSAHASLAGLRNLVTWMIRKTGVSIPEARENFREERAEAIRAVTARSL